MHCHLFVPYAGSEHEYEIIAPYARWVNLCGILRVKVGDAHRPPLPAAGAQRGCGRGKADGGAVPEKYNLIPKKTNYHSWSNDPD